MAATGIVIVAVALLQGCSATTQFQALKPGTTLVVKGSDPTALPRQERLGSQSTSQIEFKATSPDGATMYGILPLRVSGGKMAGSIMLFAPALFIGGFRDVLQFYEFVPDTKSLRYKRSADDDWRMHQPTTAESERARLYFEANGAPASDAGSFRERSLAPLAATPVRAHTAGASRQSPGGIHGRALAHLRPLRRTRVSAPARRRVRFPSTIRARAARDPRRSALRAPGRPAILAL